MRPTIGSAAVPGRPLHPFQRSEVLSQHITKGKIQSAHGLRPPLRPHATAAAAAAAAATAAAAAATAAAALLLLPPLMGEGVGTSLEATVPTGRWADLTALVRWPIALVVSRGASSPSDLPRGEESNHAPL